jgi:hypothetical protein
MMDLFDLWTTLLKKNHSLWHTPKLEPDHMGAKVVIVMR